MVRKSNSSVVKKENEPALSIEKKLVVSHPTGNTFVRALLEELQKNQLLRKYYTTIGSGYSVNPLVKVLSQKREYAIPDGKISRQWIPELVRLLSRGDQSNKRRQTDQSYLALDKKVSLKLTEQDTQVLHAYEDGAYYSFKRAKELGIQCSYELPIAHWATVRRLLAEEAERYPQWEPTLESTREPEEKLFRKEEELSMADRITCPSQFVLDSIPSEIKQKIPCQISPFGSPKSDPPSKEMVTNSSNRLKLLFVGSMSQRKGLADLFEAMHLLKKEPLSLSILGQPSMPMEFYRKQYSDFEYFPPSSNEKVREIMKMHDALVLPSIIEGRALVQQEALSCGLPIIVTRNAGGEDLVEEGLTGHLVSIRSPEKLAQCILKTLEERNSLKEKKVECLKKAKQYSWEEYASKIIESNLSTTSSILENNK
jgi:glycosyltransferase involved in cell wall biosynthesis